MFKRLRQKWNVNAWQLFCILLVFAITGTLTAWVSKMVTGWLGMSTETFWVWKLLVRLFILVFGYQFILLSVAFLLGQFAFFWQFERRLLRWLGGKRKGDPENRVS